MVGVVFGNMHVSMRTMTAIHIRMFAVWLLLVVLSPHSWAKPPATPASPDEIQVLIDVSGSMKQNDPNNMRVGAAELLISLLPDKIKATIWLFAEKTTLLSQTASVDAAWKAQAIKACSQIHSKGLFTHIEDAVETALNAGFTGNGHNHLIVLTDGVVDIDKDIMRSAESRQRVLSEQIPRLQQQKVMVQTVALSDQADKELLDKLAFDTGGWTESAFSAEALQRSFFKMAQKAAPKETVPLKDNEFMVDAGIKEFSVLVFKKPKAPPSQLIAPDQTHITVQTVSPTVSWLANPAFDLITIKQPASGTWQLVAQLDPDNQVMIVTDLRLQLADIANYVSNHEELTANAHFTDKGNLITRADFLSMIKLSLQLDHDPVAAMPALKEPKGYFAQPLPELAVGKHTLTLQADGKTFKRELVREFEVVAETIKVETAVDAKQRTLTVTLIPDAAVLEPSSLSGEVLVAHDGKAAEPQTLTLKDGRAVVSLSGFEPDTESTVSFDVSAKSLSGKTLSPSIKALTIDDSLFKLPEPDPAAETTPEDEAETDTAAEETDWGLVGMIVSAANGVFIVIAYLIWRWLRKSTASKHNQLLEKLS
jgi:hypothetical protein